MGGCVCVHMYNRVHARLSCTWLALLMRICVIACAVYTCIPSYCIMSALLHIQYIRNIPTTYSNIQTMHTKHPTCTKCTQRDVHIRLACQSYPLWDSFYTPIATQRERLVRYTYSYTRHSVCNVRCTHISNTFVLKIRTYTCVYYTRMWSTYEWVLEFGYLTLVAVLGM